MGTTDYWRIAAAYSEGGGGGGTTVGRGGRALLGRCQSSIAVRNSLSKSLLLDFFPLLEPASSRLTSRVLPAQQSPLASQDNSKIDV